MKIELNDAEIELLYWSLHEMSEYLIKNPDCEYLDIDPESDFNYLVFSDNAIEKLKEKLEASYEN